MSKMTIKLYGREYNVNHTPGEEDRLMRITQYVEGKMKDIATRNTSGTVTETRLLMLACLHITDELMDARRRADEAKTQATIESEELLVSAVEHLSQRVAHIAQSVGRA